MPGAPMTETRAAGSARRFPQQWLGSRAAARRNKLRSGGREARGSHDLTAPGTSLRRSSNSGQLSKAL